MSLARPTAEAALGRRRRWASVPSRSPTLGWVGVSSGLWQHFFLRVIPAVAYILANILTFELAFYLIDMLSFFLIGGLEHILFFHSVGNFIIPTDFDIFHTTNQLNIICIFLSFQTISMFEVLLRWPGHLATA